jgi:molybdopterin molybdotransferase
MMAVTDALATVLGRTAPGVAERIDLARGHGRILREVVTADRDLPPFDRAAMDGYAVRAADAITPGRALRIVGRVRAGEMRRESLGLGEAVAIMTGAPLPRGADAVVPVERSRSTEGDVTFDLSPAPGANVALRGSEAERGAELLPVGTRLSEADLAVLASVGLVQPLVARQPRVALIITGDEVIDPKLAPGPAQIRNANGPAIAQAIVEAGGVVIDRGVIPDDPAPLALAVAESLSADALVLSGGVSAGEFDFVEAVLERAGVQAHVTAVRVKPGAPFVFATATRGTPVFGLPGNPVSAQVTFELFVRPALLRMQGASRPFRPRLRATLSAPLLNRSGRENYLPVRARWSDETSGFVAQPILTQGSGDVAAHARANALAILGAERTRADAGETVPLHPLRGLLEVEDSRA